MGKRRSSRLSKANEANEANEKTEETSSKKRRESKRIQENLEYQSLRESDEQPEIKLTSTLPRTRENLYPNRTCIGVDEAGRGPIAGPVVAAAIIIPENVAGITDSKKITLESDREALYEKILSTPNLRYAISIIDNHRIDEINILQATLEGMKNSIAAVIKPKFKSKNRILKASAQQKGCYTIFGLNDENGKPVQTAIIDKLSYHALIDGNKVPEGLACPSTAVVKGDSSEYCIGAASILAKVTRDRIMHEYHEMYPEYNLMQHKGYPTAAHLGTVSKIGGCEIHRRSFAPFKQKVVKEKQKITSFFNKKK